MTKDQFNFWYINNKIVADTLVHYLSTLDLYAPRIKVIIALSIADQICHLFTSYQQPQSYEKYFERVLALAKVTAENGVIASISKEIRDRKKCPVCYESFPFMEMHVLSSKCFAPGITNKLCFRCYASGHCYPCKHSPSSPDRMQIWEYLMKDQIF